MLILTKSKINAKLDKRLCVLVSMASNSNFLAITKKSLPMSLQVYSRENVNQTAILAVLSTLFFMWGLITVLNIMLLDELMTVFKMRPTEALLVNFIFYATYFVIALPAGKVIKRYGFKNGIISGIVIAGFGCMLFYPAAQNREYSMFVLALFLVAAGITTLQVGANAYVVLFGKKERGASRLTLVQAFNSLGTVLAPLFAAGLFMKIAGLEEGSRLSMAPDDYIRATVKFVQLPYLALGAILFLLALFIGFSKLPKLNTDAAEPIAKAGEETPKFIIQFPHVILGAIGIFAYVGAEVTIARFLSDAAPNFADETFRSTIEKVLVPLYWGGAMVGRFIGASLLTQISPRKLVGASASIAGILLIIFLILFNSESGRESSFFVLAFIGLFNSVLFPCIFTMGLDGLGRFSEEGSAVLNMGIVGGAIVPMVWGMFFDVSIWAAFFVPVLCYLYIAYFGLKGSRFVKRTNFY